MFCSRKQGLQAEPKGFTLVLEERKFTSHHVLELPKGVFPRLRFKVFCLAGFPAPGRLSGSVHPHDHYPHLCSPSWGPSSKLLESNFGICLLRFSGAPWRKSTWSWIGMQTLESVAWVGNLVPSLNSMFVVGQSLMVSGLVFPPGNEATDKNCLWGLMRELAELAWVRDSGQCLLFLFPEIHFETNFDSIFILVTVSISKPWLHYTKGVSWLIES